MMVDPLYLTMITLLTNFTALKQPHLYLVNLNTFEYQKLDRHLQARLPVYNNFFTCENTLF